MAAKIEKTFDKGAALETQVQIVGPFKLHNELMGWYLHHTTGLKCSCCKDLELNSLPTQAKGIPALVMLDCQNCDLSSLIAKICPITESGKNGYYFALFNAAAGHPVGNDLVNRGVRGLFYNDDQLSNISKGVLAILKGEFWFSRKALVRCLLNRPKTSAAVALLTIRETEVLRMVAAGFTNNQIADRLYISLHTVKTHNYNIYKKIKAPGRVQAALWATKNLS